VLTDPFMLAAKPSGSISFLSKKFAGWEEEVEGVFVSRISDDKPDDKRSSPGASIAEEDGCWMEEF